MPAVKTVTKQWAQAYVCAIDLQTNTTTIVVAVEGRAFASVERSNFPVLNPAAVGVVRRYNWMILIPFHWKNICAIILSG